MRHGSRRAKLLGERRSTSSLPWRFCYVSSPDLLCGSFFNGGCANLSVMKSGHVDGVKRDIRICVYILVLNVHLLKSFRSSAFSGEASLSVWASTRIYLLSFSGNQGLCSFFSVLFP